MAKCQQSATMTGKSRVRFVSAIVIYHEISAFGITFNIIFFLPNPIFFSSSGAGSSAIDFTQLGNQKCYGTKQKTKISNSLLVFYLVPKHFRCCNWVKSIIDDPAPDISSLRWIQCNLVRKIMRPMRRLYVAAYNECKNSKK